MMAIYSCLCGIIALCAPSQSFSSWIIAPQHKLYTAKFVLAARNNGILYGSASPEEPDGGTAWIKDAMGSGEVGPGSGGAPSPVIPPSSPLFSQSEISEMEEVVVSLSKESDDTKRREKLAALFDKELADGTTTIPKESSNEDTNLSAAAEIPKFAQLFQISLDRVGEVVQNIAREKAKERHDREGGEIEGGDVIGQLKSPEELQLWALIDMMVQSKTIVKLHMGTMGSKGTFR